MDEFDGIEFHPLIRAQLPPQVWFLLGISRGVRTDRAAGTGGDREMAVVDWVREADEIHPCVLSLRKKLFPSPTKHIG